MTPRGGTRVAAVIGEPISHSLSPVIFNAAFPAAGLDWVYVAFEVPGGAASGALDAMRVLGLAGLSVTMPHKADVAGAVDVLSPEAAALGAVNCVVRDGEGLLVGHNTDGAGFLAGLRADTGAEIAGARVVVLGAGGAARAIVRASAEGGAAEVAIVNRDPGRAEAAAAAAGREVRVVGAAERREVLGAADIVVNATSLGMAGPLVDEIPAEAAHLAPDAVVVDIVYHPLDTRFLREARGRGHRSANGVGMLLGQAAVAFELWTGLPAPLGAMRAAVDAELSRR